MGRLLGPMSGGVGWCYICVRCESGLSVYMTGLGICVLHPAFNPVIPYGYLLPNMY